MKGYFKKNVQFMITWLPDVDVEMGANNDADAKPSKHAICFVVISVFKPSLVQYHVHKITMTSLSKSV